MLDRIDSILQQECKINRENLLLIGVSGGPDSLCLMHVVNKLGFPIIAAHVNHTLRPEADQEAQIVKQFAEQLGVEYISSRVDVQAFANERSISIEEAARTMRYQFLFEQTSVRHASAVLVGHNADDQVETILMHLMRGSGLSGLRGMDFLMLPNPWSSQIPLVRPLLSTPRLEIIKYLAENNLNPVFDKSNQDTTIFRNRLRHELIPILEGYNPRFRKNLLQASQVMRDDYALLQQLVNETWDKYLLRQDAGYHVFRLAGFTDLSPSIQRYLLRKTITDYLPGLRDVDFESIERGMRLLSNHKLYGQVDLISGLCLVKDADKFWVIRGKDGLPVSEYPRINCGVQFTLNASSTVFLDNGWELHIEEMLEPALVIEQSSYNPDPYQAWVDTGVLEMPMIVRCRIAGERIQPLGMNGHSIKVSDLMINLKLPKRARPTWPLVCSGADVLWIPGYRRSQLAQVTPESQSIVHLSLVKVATS